MQPSEHPDRRTFLGVSASCAAHLVFASCGRGREEPAFAREVVNEEAWGRIEQVAERVWALVSTPLNGNRTTLCNGGIIAGTEGVLVVESFATPEGATWVAEQTRLLTGGWPTHVVLTHYHGDHTGGVEGYGLGADARVMTTAVTRDLVAGDDAERGRDPGALRGRMLAGAEVVSAAAPTEVDLGGRTVTVVPRDGHTASDLTVEVDGPGIVFCGDLVWNRMFPNYRDAVPSRLSRDVRALARDRETLYVPGHGPLADAADLDRYLAVIDLVEEAARRAFDAGTPAAEAAAAFSLPESLGEWVSFSPRYHEVALGAWERELRGG